ncbi:MAG TPA: VWA domain-containing protein [Anaerolineae bacterium]|nr:VWA domain-containing protein [Anaerolineae bacterium]
MKHMLRKVLGASIWVLTISSTFVSVAFADGMMIPFGAEFGYVQVEYHHVRVTIEDSIARTRVDQRFLNPYGEAIEIRYIFPLPPLASIRDFQIQLEGQPVTVEKLSVLESEMFLRNAITYQSDPTLLQFFGWEAYAVNLSLPASGSVTMVLEYSETLPTHGNLFHYFYTLGTERYSTALLADVSVEVDVLAQESVAAVYSPSHPILMERVGPRHVKATYHEQNVLPIENFELYFAVTEGPVGAGLLTHADRERDGEGHFLFLLSPSSVMDTGIAMPKDIVFVIDRSGSMAGEKIDQAKNALQYILGKLGEGDRFAIVSFDDLIESPSNELQRVTDRSIQDARSYVSRLYDRGNTDIEGALRRGITLVDRAGFRPDATRLIVFLTDGLPTAGITDERTIVDRVRQANDGLDASLHVFGVGYDVNTHLLDDLASQNHGTVTYVQPGESLEGVLTSFYGKIAHPLLTDLELRYEGFTVTDVYPRQLPDLYFGSSIAVTGRYTNVNSDEVSVRLSGRFAGEPTTQLFNFSLDDEGENPFISRLWATRRVGDLLDEVRVKGETAPLVDEIETLGLRYGIVTPYTIDIVQAQLSGVSSGAVMQLYHQDLDGDGVLDINKVSGEATIGARVQNQTYQQAMQSNQATGSNITNNGDKSVAQVGYYALDLELFVRRGLDPSVSLDENWVAGNVDHVILFGSDEYFELARDSSANQILQAGSNVILEYDGQIIAVQEDVSPMQNETVEQEIGFLEWLLSMLEWLFN